MKHKHHIIPKYMGGDNSPDNLTPPISVPLHAALHKDLYEKFGHWEDLCAYKMLLGESLSGFSGRLGKKHTEESKRKMSLAAKGKKKSAIACQNMSKAHKGKPSTFKGKKHSRESIEKNRQAHIGKKYHLGFKHSDETKLKMRLAKLGHIPWNKGLGASA